MDKWTIGYEADTVSLIMPRQNASDLLYALTLALGPTSLSAQAAATPSKPTAVPPAGSTTAAGGSISVDEEMRTLDPRLVRRRADLASEPKDRIVLRREPCSTAIDRRPVRELVCPDPAADAVTCFEDDDGLALLAQPPCCSEPCVSRTDDADVCVHPLRHEIRTVVD